jgi:SAM-dependent methyltransferase
MQHYNPMVSVHRETTVRLHARKLKELNRRATSSLQPKIIGLNSLIISPKIHDEREAMSVGLSKNVTDVLACPQCGSSLEINEAGCRCVSCTTEYASTANGSLDLRLRQPREYPLTFTLGEPLPRQSDLDVLPQSKDTEPEVDYSTFDIPHHMSLETLNNFPAALTPNSLALDLGSGSGVHKLACEHAGFEYVGLDLDTSSSAAILGDAQSLPFDDNSFEFILSIAALEHIRYPFVAMREIHRVLKPGGRYLGTVAFNYPFHGDSFYHCTHLGTINLLEYAGFKIEDISASGRSVIIGHARNLFPRMPHKLAYAIVYPLVMLHKA